MAGFEAEPYMLAAAAALGLEVAPAHRPGVVLNLERIAQMAAMVTNFPLPEAEEPAPVFRP